MGLTDKKLGIAIVGLGNYASDQIIPALSKTKEFYLAGLVSSNAEKLTNWATKFGVPKHNTYTYDDLEKIKDNSDIDVMYIASPVSLHKEFVKIAAKAKKHVICEKPMAVTVQDCEEMIAACNEANVLLSIGYRLHYDPRHKQIMDLARKGFGKIIDFEAAFGFIYNDNPQAWRLQKDLAGGGSLMDLGIYTIQAARYTLGQEPIAVTAFEKKVKPDLFREVDETVFFELEFADGFKAKCKSSYNAEWSYIRVITEQGVISIEPAFQYNGIEGQLPSGRMDYPQVAQQALQMDDFAICIRENKVSKVSGEEGLNDIRIINAIYNSLSSGNREMV